ncbi:MAG: DUF1707 domain-containing protein [Actinomycetota bacterium]|jgi:hypothetical protein|nr:DUF1707 domain-containing protein [Euzebyaceae bacterium]MDQ3452319.1 DUF1707 domain-containing protein [Actinomycetota bacterium]
MAATPTTIAPAGETLVSDADRELVARTLGHHTAEGRLTLDELSDRLGEAYGARVGSELELVLRDLPVTPPEDLPPTEVELAKARRDFRAALRTYVIVGVVLLGIWAASGAEFFWPIWPLGGWGFSLYRQYQGLRDGVVHQHQHQQHHHGRGGPRSS